MKHNTPTIRLHLWLESENITVFGLGRLLLLDRIEELGSIRKASQQLGMSYRAAWGKIQASEESLGVKLVEIPGKKRDGCRLTAEGRRLRDMYKRWFAAVEEEALSQAKSIFPWEVDGFDTPPHQPDRSVRTVRPVGDDKPVEAIQSDQPGQHNSR